MKYLVTDYKNSMDFMIGLMKLKKENPLFMEQTLQALEGSDVCMYGTCSGFVRDAADKIGIPCIRYFYSPYDRTDLYSLYSVEHNTPSVAKSYDAITGGMPMLSNLLMGKWRKKNGIPKVKSFEHYTAQNGRKVLTFYPVSPILMPKDPKWGKHIHVTGYWYHPEEDACGYEADTELEHFLTDGEKPIFIAFGKAESKELAELQDKFRSMKAKWENEKNAIGKVQTLREQIEQTNAAIEKAQREYDLNKAAELKYGKLPQLQKQLAEEEKVAAAKKEDSLLRDRVTDEEIARIVARWTGIPVEKLVEGEREKLLHLDDVLHQRVIGQDEAVTKVSEAILRSRAGIANPNRPIGSFLFLGPTGVGKTELAKALAQALFDDERNMVRIDMTEYMEKFSVSRLIGAPPGYVGYEEGGQLTEAVRRKPYSVVLFDEVEKAHPDVFNILLQVLDDGRITDSQGRTVDFKNTVIILTSNLGSDIILNDLEQRRAQGSNELSEDAKHQIDLLLKSKFRPEFLNRLDEIVYYKSLTKDEMRKIVDLQLQDLRNRMEEGKHLKLEVTTAAKDFIIDSAYDSVYGARPIKRFIQSRVETLIAKAIIKGNYAEGDTLTVDYDGSALVLR